MDNILKSTAEELGVKLPVDVTEYLQTGGENGNQLRIGGYPFRVKPSVLQIERWVDGGGLDAVAILRQAAVTGCIETSPEALNG